MDGTINSSGTISRYADVDISIGSEDYQERFLVTNLGTKKIILGLPWLERHNPRINWQTRLVELREKVQANREWGQARETILNALSADPKQFSAMAFAREEAAKHQDMRTLDQMIPARYHKFLSVFDKKAAGRFPPSRLYDHAINLKPGYVPKASKVYPMTLTEQEFVDAFLADNLDKGYIRASESPEAAGFFVGNKKDGDKRPLTDYRHINEWTVKNSYPLPLQSELMDKLQGAKWFTKLDLRSGYNNIRIKDGDQWKTAFITNRGLYEPTVMFFGLCNSPATFQAFMNDIFRIEIVGNVLIIYMDDILLFASTLEELRQKTEAVLQKLRDNDLFCKPEKCVFETQEVEYLGFIIRPDQVNMDPVKIEGITQWPTPKSIKEVQQFLGFANFYRRFVPGYADITRPLDKLRSNKDKWIWTPECE